jgi:hypothetical protein
MQKVSRFVWPSAGLALVIVLLLSTLLVSLDTASPALAQSGPTPTPTDPAWLAFAEARDAVQEEFSVKLDIIRDYSWNQALWEQGIDSCVDLEEDADPRRDVVAGYDVSITDMKGTVYNVRVSYSREDVAICDRTEAAAAPAATAAPDGSLPTPVPGAAAVGGFELGGHVLELSANTTSLMNRAGMRWVKKQLRYNQGDSPSNAAGPINLAKANGFKVLLGIVGQPSQLGAGGDAYIAGYAEYVAGVAALGADAIEVWNEPNIDREWPAGQVNGANYTKLLAAAYNAIKARNPNTLVISGAPAPTGFFGAAGCADSGCNDDVFMQQMAAAGAAQYMDCVGLHYNEGIVSPNTNSGDPRGEYPSYYFNSMLARGYNPFGGKPVCFTELGYLSGEGFTTPLPGNFAWAGDTSVQEHATWLAEAATIAARSGKVRLMIIWNVDFPFYTPTDPMGGYAMNRPGGGCPACDTLGAVMR